MTWIEALLIATGVLLDLFASMESQGSIVSKINKWHLSGICLLIGTGQLLALGAGIGIANLMYYRNQITNEIRLVNILAVIIYLGLGIRLLVKACRKEFYEERLQRNFRIGRFIRIAASTGVYTFLAGIAFEIMEIPWMMGISMTVGITIIVVIAGMYTGYHFGHMHKKKAYITGAVLLLAAGIDVMIRSILSL